jgi:E3 ubiquitin-protein ligase NRDP1
MGFDINRCVSIHLEDNFLCSICCGIIENPKKILRCDHIFCQKCITVWILEKSKCPIDKNEVDLTQLTDVCEQYFEEYSKILLKCEFFKYGCDESIRIIHTLTHSENCKYNRDKYKECQCGDCVALNGNFLDFSKYELKINYNNLMLSII